MHIKSESSLGSCGGRIHYKGNVEVKHSDKIMAKMEK